MLRVPAFSIRSAVIIIVALLGTSLRAQTWIGAPNCTFSTAGNWSTGVVPHSSAATAEFIRNGSSCATNLTLTTASLGGIHLHAGAGSLTLKVSNSLTLSGSGLVNDSEGSLFIQATTLGAQITLIRDEFPAACVAGPTAFRCGR